ncbi:PaaI family thioesterase [Kribbia dieselivorans]|uniref:PaaI family thioesterase n=1 Tax=Kribbia dieselivorans TaxID=331526 RepID=UPI000B2EAB3E|nr:PaaI family thioesterase [Kribbia dieselivorans]
MKAPSAFVVASGLVIDEVGPTHVSAHADFGPDQHTDEGVVHGGVYATIVEAVAGAGATAAVTDRGQFSVGVHNATDFLRSISSGRALITGDALHQGRTQQLWEVVITAEATGKVLARGQLRLQNISRSAD